VHERDMRSFSCINTVFATALRRMIFRPHRNLSRRGGDRGAKPKASHKIVIMDVKDEKGQMLYCRDGALKSDRNDYGYDTMSGGKHYQETIRNK